MTPIAGSGGGYGTGGIAPGSLDRPGIGPNEGGYHTGEGGYNTAANKIRPEQGLIPKSRTAGLHCRFSRIPGETPKDVLKTPLWLPAIINTLRHSLDQSQGYQDYTTVSAGTFTTPPAGDKNANALRTLDPLETLTVFWDPPWLVEHGLNAASVERTLLKIVRSKRPVQMLLAVARSPGNKAKPEIRMDVTIRAIATELRGGEPDTHYISLPTIVEWRDTTIDRRGSGDGRKRGVHLPTKHRLRNTDTLASLSMEFYGTYRHWRLIRNANGISHKFGSHAIIVYNTRFQTGHWIKIPKLTHKPKGGQAQGPGAHPSYSGAGLSGSGGSFG